MRKLLGIMLLTIFFILAACNNSPESNESEASNDGNNDDNKPKEDQTEKSYESVFPLTGEPTNKQVDQRVLSVQVNNHTQARPQSGLSQADVVYEVLAEGQITRFLALFHSEIPDTIGPVRSARPYFFEIADGFDALYTYHGAAQFINDQVKSSGIDFADGAIYDNDGVLFERTTDRVAPHNSYLLTSGIDQLIERKGYETEKAIDTLPFSEESDLEGESTDHVTVTYSENEKVTYDYDSESEQYLRSSDGEPTIDRENDERIALKNVLIIKTKHAVVDDAGRREINLTSGGEGYLLQKGQLIDVQWKNKDGRILPYKNDKAVNFVPGQTWMNIIPNNQGNVSTE
ncbi:DUF3048 domain-containing protein [Halobacillus seohaensis]|uniref:DUF3048 domain-containing protein n=1 Tax=Halobacillus seohaensis TaxID=447421 RepID=A0ABW2ELP5_9BACI